MITWYLDEKEADYVLNVLAQRPFAEVNQLITKMIQQANPPKVQESDALREATERLERLREAKREQMRAMQNTAFQDMDEHTARIGDELVRRVDGE